MRLLRILFLKSVRAAYFGKKDEEIEFFYLKKKNHESSTGFLIFYLFYQKWGNKILRAYYPLRCNKKTSSSGIMVKIGGGAFLSVILPTYIQVSYETYFFPKTAD